MKYGITLALLAVMSAPLVGIAADGKPAVTDEQLSKMQQQLQLSDEQVAKMRQIRDDGGSRKDMRAVLTDEQKAQGQAKVKEGKSGMTEEQLGRMQKQLKLSDEQVAKMRQIQADGGSKQDVLAVLTDEQKAQAKEMKQQRQEKGEKAEKGEKKAKNKAADTTPDTQA
jgi:Spy/CpxP family protein refolding chaperone